MSMEDVLMESAKKSVYIMPDQIEKISDAFYNTSIRELAKGQDQQELKYVFGSLTGKFGFPARNLGNMNYLDFTSLIYHYDAAGSEEVNEYLSYVSGFLRRLVISNAEKNVDVLKFTRISVENFYVSIYGKADENVSEVQNKIGNIETQFNTVTDLIKETGIKSGNPMGIVVIGDILTETDAILSKAKLPWESEDAYKKMHQSCSKLSDLVLIDAGGSTYPDKFNLDYVVNKLQA